MRGSIAKVVLADAGFMLALIDQKDEHHRRASELYKHIEEWHALVPWPALYETVSTRTARSDESMIRLAKLLRSPGIKQLDDTPYREVALTKILDGAHRWLKLSLVDVILRDILVERKNRIDGFATFNEVDFDDVCRRRRVPILPRDVEMS